MAKPVSAVWMLARRFVFSAKTSDGFISFISGVSVVGVALGVLALVVVTSVINGFESELVRVITGMNGDVVFYTRGEPVSDPENVESRIRRLVPGVQAITPSFVTELMVSGPSSVAGAVLEGLDLERVGLVTAVPKRIVSGRLPSQTGEVALGASLADRIGAAVGADIRLVIPSTGEDSSGSSGPRSTEVRIVGIVKMGMYEYDSKTVFSTLESVQKLLSQPGRVTSFKLKLMPGVDSRGVADRLSDHFGYPFRAKDWALLNKNLFYAIRLEKVAIAIILTVIVIVAAFNVVSALMMLMHDKAKEISILKAMGFRPGQGFRLFSIIGLGMGFVGTSIGILLGLALNRVIASTRLIQLPEDIYYIGFLPVVVRWNEVALIAACAMIIAFVATLYPAMRVARKSPLEGMRYE